MQHDIFPSVDYAKVVEVLAALERERVDYVLIGGVAMGLHGLVRATDDMDFFIRPDASNIERLKSALRTVWNDPAIDDIQAQDLLGDYPAVRYGPPEGELFLDILTRLGDAFRFEDLAVETVRLENVAVKIATPTTLYQMKKGTVRALDRQDAEALRLRFGLTDEG